MIYRNLNEFCLWNCISICKALTIESVEMCSDFGGLISFEKFEEDSSSIRVNIHRVVLTTSYRLLDSNRAET